MSAIAVLAPLRAGDARPSGVLAGTKCLRARNLRSSSTARVRGGTFVERSFEMATANRMSVVLCLCCGLLGSDVALTADQEAPVPLAERARGADRVVVGRVATVVPVWQVNEFGDRLIVSTVRVIVSETLKGQAVPALDVDVEGGTIGELTLRVSDQTSLSPGDRAVFYLNRLHAARTCRTSAGKVCYSSTVPTASPAAA